MPTPAREPSPAERPAPVTVSAVWPAHRQLCVDLARGGAVVGLVVGAVLGGPTAGMLGLMGGSLGGAVAGWWIGPRRYRLRVDDAGVRIGRLLRTTVVPWPEVRAFGVVETWTGRRGRVIGLAVCRAGTVLPIAVPALTFTETGWRIGSGPRPDEAIEVHRPQLLEPVRHWAELRGVPTIATDVDSWWDLNQDR